MKNKLYNQFIEVRDSRNKAMYRLDDAYLNGYARLCGIAATAIYNSLCRHSDSHQQSFPSIDLMAEQHAINRKTVIKAIKTLEKWGIISVIKQKDTKTKRQKNNVYVLVDKSNWKQKPSPFCTLGSQKAESLSGHEPSPSEGQSRVPVEDYKDTHIKDTHIKDITDVVTSGNENKIFDVFYNSINPAINYANKQQRNAATWLIGKMGLEKAIAAAEFAVSVQGQQYAPIITTPYQLKEKLSQLIIYKQKENDNKITVTQV